ncbi:MAG: ATP-binding protein [Myxococcota bacterium]|nr:ATP-binding protein [Myxococcota bacterium]
MKPALLASPGHKNSLIFWVDEQMHVQHANDTALSMLGMESADVIGKPMATLLVAGSRKRLEQAREGQRLLMELCRADGQRLWVAYSVQPGSRELNTLSTHTATPLESPDLGELLNERIQAERRNIHDELFGSISHNVNNLLTTILSPAQLLLKNTHDPQVREEVSEILQATQRARTLLRDMYRSVRCKPEPLEPLSLASLLSDVTVNPMVRGVQVQLTLPLLPPVLGVSEGLKTILFALLSNAAEAGAKTVNITAHHKNDRVELLVADDGSGIDAALLARLFEPFSTTKSRVGAGLSLATSRSRLMGWGGGLSASSTPAGATFTLNLQTAPASLSIPVRAQNKPQRRVLLVEDEPIVASTLKRVFSLCSVDIASTVNQAFQLFSPGKYDVILISLALSEMPGNKLATYLRDQDSKVSMLMLTGWRISIDDPRMRPFEDRIQKPIGNLVRVRQKLSEAIQRTRERRSQ